MEQTVGQLTEYFRNVYGLGQPDLTKYSPLTLAYIGDAVYELVLRTYVVGQGNAPVVKLHHRTSDLVNAHTQSELARLIMDDLSEEETAVYKRGRNARSYTKAKNASTADYRRATGLEALVGYLYLAGRYERLISLIHDGLQGLTMI